MNVELALLIGAVSSHLATPTAPVAMTTLSSVAEPVATVVLGTSSDGLVVALDPRLHTT